MKDNKEYFKEYYKNNKEAIKKNKQKWYNIKKLDHWIVYYLPEEHYCGITNDPYHRMKTHDQQQGHNTTGWKVLYCSEDKKDAGYHEGLFQTVLGIEGLNIKEEKNGKD